MATDKSEGFEHLNQSADWVGGRSNLNEGGQPKKRQKKPKKPNGAAQEGANGAAGHTQSAFTLSVPTVTVAVAPASPAPAAVRT